MPFLPLVLYNILHHLLLQHDDIPRHKYISNVAKNVLGNIKCPKNNPPPYTLETLGWTICPTDGQLYAKTSSVTINTKLYNDF